MIIQDLVEFVVLARTNSFQKAAAELGISHSTLTKHIQRMEAELKQTLFTRTTRSVELSKFGRAYLPYAEKIAQCQEDACRTLEELGRLEQNTLHLACIPAPERYGLAELISGFQQEHPDIFIELLDSGDSQTILQEGRCDFAIAPRDSIHSRDSVCFPYIQDRLAVVFPEHHPLAGESAVTLEQIQAETFILHSDTRGSIQNQTRLILRLCHAAGFQPQASRTVDYSSTMVRLVSNGEGIAVMNRLHVPGNIPGVSIVDLAPEVPYEICLFCKEKENSTYAELAFRDYIGKISR